MLEMMPKLINVCFNNGGQAKTGVPTLHHRNPYSWAAVANMVYGNFVHISVYMTWCTSPLSSNMVYGNFVHISVYMSYI